MGLAPVAGAPRQSATAIAATSAVQRTRSFIALGDTQDRPASRRSGGRRRREIDLAALDADLQRGRFAPQIGPALERRPVEGVEEVVGVQRVVVEEEEPLG